MTLTDYAKDKQRFIHNYECLRDEVMGAQKGSHRHGLALLMSQGMYKWMEIWNDCLVQNSPVAQFSNSSFNQGIRENMIQLLTRILLSMKTEVTG